MIVSRVEKELSTLSDARVLDHIRSLLVDPEPVSRPWDYGEPGERIECWSVLDHPASKSGVAYCEQGFGPENPWGLVAIDRADESMSLGMDSGWFPSFLEAYFESFASADIPIWRVFRRTDEPYPGLPISDELSWDLAWERVRALRKDDTVAQYTCHHAISYGRGET